MNTISSIFGGIMKEDKLKIFSKLYLDHIKKDRNKFINDILEENKYLNIILSNLTSLRYKTTDDLVEKYTSIILKVKDKLYKNSLIHLTKINDQLDIYFLFIIEKLCPVINNSLDDNDLKLFISAMNCYFYNNKQELIKICDDIKNKEYVIDIDNIDDYISFIKEYDINSNDEYKLKERLKAACDDLSLLNNIIF